MVERRGTRDTQRMRQSTSGLPDLRFHGTVRGLFQAAAMASLAAVLACSGSAKQNGEEPDPSGAATEPGTEDGAETPDRVEPTIELGPITKGSFREHPAGVVWVFEDDPENPKKMDIGEAEARGYTIVDLSDDWVPYIFSEKTAGADDEQDNTYRDKYIGLANNEIDLWGDELEDHERNYLELYGIPPTLSVIQDEWSELQTEVVPCLEAAGYDRSVFGTFDGTIVFKKSGQSKRNKSARWYQSKVEHAMKKAKLDPSNPDDMAAAATHPKTKKIYNKWREFADEVDVIDHAQRRFRCEKMFNGGDGTGTYDEGVYDSATTHALANFERKHDIMGWGHFKSDNVAVLAMEPDQAQYERMKRVLAERLIISAGILEDGSAREWKHSTKKGHWKYKDTEGNEHELRDLATEYTDALVAALGIDTPEKAKQRLAMLSDLGKGFDSLLVAAKMPEKPPYYSDNMAFSTVIDRGDVWYDFPYDAVGNKVGQPRRQTPRMTLYVEYADQKIPVVHWRTTIGSWRNEIKDGEVMLKYKNSDVGPRVWKDIMAAPVWIPPANTPAAELIRGRWRNGKFKRDVDYPTTGPGYRSAYGLVAAYHVKLVERADGTVAEFDNGIRTHGSVDYMSILRRYSHGCHRLYNMDAVRLFSFILLHRDYKREGQQQVGVGRYIEYEERTYHMKLDTRGYKYELVEPIDVEVTNGRIRGRRKRPIEDYVPRPVPPEEIEDGEDGEDGDDSSFDTSNLPPLPTAPVF